MTTTPTSPGVPTTITNLPTAGAITGSELVPIVQNGVTCRTPASSLTGGGGGGGVTSIIAGEGISVSNPTGAVTVGLATPVAVTDGGTGVTTSTGTGSVVLAGSPVLSGTPTAPTASGGTNTTQIATTQFVQTAISGLTSTTVFSAISGLLFSSIAGTSTTASITVSAGQGTDSTNTAYITKGTATSWSITNGNAINGYSGGSTLPNSSTIHLYICTGGTGTGIYAIPSSAYPLLAASAPPGYNTYVRRVGSFNTGVTGAPIPYTMIEVEGGATVNWLVAQTLDVSVVNLSTTRILYALNVPLSFILMPIIRHSTNSNNFYILTSGNETDVAPATVVTAAPQMSGTDDYFSVSMLPAYDFLTTNTSGQIGARANAASTSLYIVTRGWKDFRRN